MFDLSLRFAPAFHRTCSIRTIGDLCCEATLEAPPSGLLPGIVLTLGVDAADSEQLRASCHGMFQTWDARWSNSGLDGISIDGTFENLHGKPRTFGLWSPPKNSAAHAMLAAALACFPPRLCVGAAEGPIEILRSYLGLQPAVVAMGEGPIRLRLAPWLHQAQAKEVEQELRSLPEGISLIVDASGIERFGHALPSYIPMSLLRKRSSSIRWIAREDAADALRSAGVPPSEIETVPRSRLTGTGHPIVLGGLVVSDQELFALARSGAKIDLTRALREKYRLTMAQAAQATAELVELMGESEASS